MKTNQIMIREGMVKQRTCDNYFDANTLIDQWNKVNNDKRQLHNYFKTMGTKDYIQYLIESEGIEKPVIRSRGKGGGTWVHPKIFIDLAMWTSIEFKAKVIDWVLDGLIKSRHGAGDYYNKMCATIMKVYVEVKGSKPPAKIYADEANAVREIAGVGKDRNVLTEKELNKVIVLQKANTLLIQRNVGKKSRRKNLEFISQTIDM